LDVAGGEDRLGAARLRRLGVDPSLDAALALEELLNHTGFHLKSSLEPTRCGTSAALIVEKTREDFEFFAPRLGKISAAQACFRIRRAAAPAHRMDCPTCAAAWWLTSCLGSGYRG